MALANRLAMRQGQAMVLTPQLLQAIKLLQMPNAELAAFIEAELERNPLLERADELPNYDPPAAGSETAAPDAPDIAPGDWASETLESDPDVLARNLGTEIDNAFEPDRPPTPAEPVRAEEGQGLSATSWTGAAGGRGFDEEAPDLEAYARRPDQLLRAPDPPGDDRPQRSGRPDDRRGADRRARRIRLPDRAAGRDRRTARRAARPRRGGAGGGCTASSRPACSPATSPNAWRCN